MFMLIDSHCHLDAALFAADRGAVLARAQERGISDLVVPAVGLDTWPPILALARRKSVPKVHAALGVHPVSLAELAAERDPDLLSALEAELQATHGELVAVGECGLDAAIDLSRADFTRQERVLVAQLELARRFGLPVILHARGAQANRRLLELCSRHALGPQGGVVHSYSGGADLVPSFAALGLYFGFAGPATYPDARRVRASIAAVPLERLLIETDAPDQTPAPHRPGRCEPSYLADVLEAVAAARHLPAAELALQTTANARRLFALD